jgi:UDP-2-acetamido-3-amino-2,3-dideoxy-glucuronate N-acetyltransferase
LGKGKLVLIRFLERLTEWLFGRPADIPPAPPRGMLVISEAHVDRSCSIGDGTRVWQFSSVIRGAVVGKSCNVASCSIIDGAQVGDNCLIGHGAQLHPGTKIGNRVFVGPGAIICNDMWPSVSKVGFGIPEGRWTVIVEDDAIIGAGAIILPGVRIHRGGMVAAGACVDRDVQAGMIWRRNGYMAQIPEDAREWRMFFVKDSA